VSFAFHDAMSAAGVLLPSPELSSLFVDGRDVGESVGTARLHTYLISHRPHRAFTDEVPYAIAVVELEEGPRMMTNIVGVENTPEGARARHGPRSRL